MMNFMDKLNCLIVGCATVFYIYGGNEGVSPCEVMITVKRGTTWRAVPRQPLTISCPVTLCGESQEVTWCKILNPNYCEPISTTQNVEIRQIDGENELISSLTFKKVSINDDGQYRCLIGNNSQIVSHAINVSFAGTNQGNESYSNDDIMSQSPDAYKSDSWMPYFYICVSILLLITSLTVLTLLGFHGWKKKWFSNHTQQKEISTELPSTPRLKISVLKDIDCSSSAEIPAENQPAPENPAVSQVPQSPVYADIDHQHSWKVTRKQPAAHENDEETKYAAINLH